MADVKHCPGISGQSPKHSNTTRVYRWWRTSKKLVCCSMLQPELLSCCPSPRLVCWPHTISSSIPSPKFSICQNPSKRCDEIDAGVIQGWTHSASFTDLWQTKILPVLSCGQTQLCGKMLPSFSTLCIFIFFFNFLLEMLWTVVFFCKHI